MKGGGEEKQQNMSTAAEYVNAHDHRSYISTKDACASDISDHHDYLFLFFHLGNPDSVKSS